jgi:hypothetical protein
VSYNIERDIEKPSTPSKEEMEIKEQSFLLSKEDEQSEEVDVLRQMKEDELSIPI